MSRELTNGETILALNLCHLRSMKIGAAHPWIGEGCPTCRADIVRLVDAQPAAVRADATAPLPEVREEDVDWMRAESKSCAAQYRDRLTRILAVLEAVRARQGGPHG